MAAPKPLPAISCHSLFLPNLSLDFFNLGTVNSAVHIFIYRSLLLVVSDRKPMEDSVASFSLSSLLCHENESFLNEEKYELKYMKLKSCFASEDEDEYIEKLVQRETILGLKSYISSDEFSEIGQNWARSDAIQWMLKTRAYFGFHFHTAYLSVNYFDRFLSRRFIDIGKLWAIRLLSVACLSLAAKMEECRAPLLSEYPTEEYEFESNVIQRMELLVLNTLEWKMVLVTPFAFLHYFIHTIFGKSKQKELVCKAVQLVMAIIKEIKLVDHRPSIIAAAAVLTAFDSQMSRGSLGMKLSVISSWGSQEYEHIFSYCTFMQEIEMGKYKTPKKVISPNMSSIHSRSTDVLGSGSSSFTSALFGTKRKLEFDDSDQNRPLKKFSGQ